MTILHMWNEDFSRTIVLNSLSRSHLELNITYNHLPWNCNPLGSLVASIFFYWLLIQLPQKAAGSRKVAKEMTVYKTHLHSGELTSKGLEPYSDDQFEGS